MEVQTHGDQGYDESFSGVGTQVEVKVSVDDGLRIEPIRKPVGEKKQARRR